MPADDIFIVKTNQQLRKSTLETRGSDIVCEREDGLDRPEVVREVRPRIPEVPRWRLSSALQGHALHLRARRDSPR